MVTFETSFRIKEQFVESKFGPGGLCEDAVVVTDHFVALMDGATDKTGRLYDGEPGGVFAVRVLSDVVRNLDPSVSAVECISQLATSLAAATKTALADAPEADHPSATIVLFSARAREIWRVGGDSYRVNGQTVAGTKRLEEVAARARALLLEELLLEGHSVTELRTTDPGRELILPILQREYLCRNRADLPWGFGTIDGGDVPSRFLEIAAIAAPSAVVFASDGYPIVGDTLTETEALLQRTLADDPLRIHQPATKGVRPGQVSFDDRSYVCFTVE